MLGACVLLLRNPSCSAHDLVQPSQAEASPASAKRALLFASLSSLLPLQLEQWAGSFTVQSILWVDAVVWTQAASDAVQRQGQGQFSALNTLHERVLLRLESLTQLLARLKANNSSSAGSASQEGNSLQRQPSGSPTHGGGCGGGGQELAQQQLRSLRALVSAGVQHRQVSQALREAAKRGQLGVVWQQQLHHYWHPQQAELQVTAF